VVDHPMGASADAAPQTPVKLTELNVPIACGNGPGHWRSKFALTYSSRAADPDEGKTGVGGGGCQSHNRQGRPGATYVGGPVAQQQSDKEQPQQTSSTTILWKATLRIVCLTWFSRQHSQRPYAQSYSGVVKCGYLTRECNLAGKYFSDIGQLHLK
jgi:hypothetical protein